MRESEREREREGWVGERERGRESARARERECVCVFARGARQGTSAAAEDGVETVVLDNGRAHAKDVFARLDHL